MARFYNADAQVLIDKTAAELKKNSKMSPPEWAAYVKTGNHRERPPADKDWWYVRSAAVLRKVAILGPIGVAKLRTKYGGKKRRGHKPSHFKKASGNVIRKVLQRLQTSGYISYKKDGVHKGRIITNEGMSFLDTIANTCIPKYEKKKAVVQPKVQAPAETKPADKEAAPEVKNETPKETKPVAEPVKTEAAEPKVVQAPAETKPAVKEAAPEVKNETPKETKPVAQPVKTEAAPKEKSE